LFSCTQPTQADALLAPVAAVEVPGVQGTLPASAPPAQYQPTGQMLAAPPLAPLQK